MTSSNYDPSRIPPATIGKVDQIGKKENLPTKIDSEAEYAELSQMLNGGVNRHEAEYIRGIMLEYENSKVSKAAKAEIEAFKGLNAPPDVLDENEARVMLARIETAGDDLSQDEIAAMKREIKDAGFVDLLSKSEAVAKAEPTQESAPPLSEPKTSEVKPKAKTKVKFRNQPRTLSGSQPKTQAQPEYGLLSGLKNLWDGMIRPFMPKE